MKIIPELHGAIIPSEEDIRKALYDIGWKKILSAIAETFVEESLGNTKCPPKLIIDMPQFNNDLRAMPSYMEKYPEFIGIKVVGACMAKDRGLHLPLVMGEYILRDAETEQPLMICDCGLLTAFRTAAASVVAITEFATSTEILGMIGCGIQAIYHLDALLEDASFGKVLINDLKEENMERLESHFPSINFVRSDKRDIFKESGIVVTSTPTRQPHMFADDIPDKDMVIAAIGGDSATKMEFGADVLGKVDYFCDSYAQASHIGVVLEAMEDGIMSKDDLKSIGDVMTGKKHPNDKKVKMFLSTGTALEDIALAVLMYKYFKANMGGLLK